MATIYIETHGCQMNEADSQYIVRRATSAGYTLAERAENASVLVLNTCTVRDNAEKRAYGRLHHWKAIKSADPSVRVVVAGCLAEQDRDRMASLLPHVDGVFGHEGSARARRRARKLAAGVFRRRRNGRPRARHGNRRHERRGHRSVRRIARLPEHPARLLVFLHVLHRAACARAFRPSAAGRHPR